MPNVTNELFKEINADGDEWVDVECDGCGAMLGACPKDEWPEKELVLCGTCTPDCCSYSRLEQVDPVKYADEIAKQKKAIKDCDSPFDTGTCEKCGKTISALHVYCNEHSPPF